MNKSTAGATEYVYVVASADCVKIGHTSNPKKRLSVLQVSNPVTLTMPMLLQCEDAVSLELYLQQHFVAHLVHGEWYRITAVQVQYEINQMIANQEIKASVVDPSPKKKRELPKKEPILYSGDCKWCGVGFFATNAKQEFCDDPNHRIYYSKRKRKELEKVWIEICWVWSNQKVQPQQAKDLLELDRKRVETLVSALGFRYSWISKSYVYPFPPGRSSDIGFE